MAKKFSSKRLVFETLRFETLRLVATLALLKIVSIFASGQVHPDEGRVHITFFKGASGNGSGYLFFQGQKYGLGVSSAKIGRVWATTIDLIGTASNLRNAADIIGTYIALDAKSATITHSKIARLENAKGSLTFER